MPDVRAVSGSPVREQLRQEPSLVHFLSAPAAPTLISSLIVRLRVRHGRCSISPTDTSTSRTATLSPCVKQPVAYQLSPPPQSVQQSSRQPPLSTLQPIRSTRSAWTSAFSTSSSAATVGARDSSVSAPPLRPRGSQPYTRSLSPVSQQSLHLHSDLEDLSQIRTL